MITIRKANKSDAQVIYDLRSRAILNQCSQYYSEEQLLLWTQGGLSDRFIEDVVETFYVSEVDFAICQYIAQLCNIECVIVLL